MYGAGSIGPIGSLPNTGNDPLLIALSLFSVVVGVLIVATTIIRVIAKRHYKA
jgi:hypothetical protein